MAFSKSKDDTILGSSSRDRALVRLGGSDRKVDPPSTGSTLNDDDVIGVLSRLDDRLVERLEEGVMKLVRSSYMKQPFVLRIQRRQELEELQDRLVDEGAAVEKLPLLTPQEAVALIRRGNRSVGALTYGWLSPGDPDPVGDRLEVVRRALEQNEHVEALFWDYASLFQVCAIRGFTPAPEWCRAFNSPPLP